MKLNFTSISLEAVWIGVLSMPRPRTNPKAQDVLCMLGFYGRVAYEEMIVITTK